jgi:GABA(A) receptor-associated protein
MDFIKNNYNKTFTSGEKSKRFKNIYSFDERQRESTLIKKKYCDRVPIIVERSNDNIPLLDKKKYLVPHSLTIGEFILVIRRKIKLNQSVGMYLFFNNNILVSSSEYIGDSYNKYKDADGFLYIKYSGENTFGK